MTLLFYLECLFPHCLSGVSQPVDDGAQHRVDVGPEGRAQTLDEQPRDVQTVLGHLRIRRDRNLREYKLRHATPISPLRNLTLLHRWLANYKESKNSIKKGFKLENIYMYIWPKSQVDSGHLMVAHGAKSTLLKWESFILCRDKFALNNVSLGL